MGWEAYDPPKIAKKPRQVYYGVRRAKVAKLLTEGKSHRAIAEELGVSKGTVTRDAKWLKSSEHLLKAQETAKELVEDGMVLEGEIVPITEMPTNLAEWRGQERDLVIQLVARKLTYRQVAEALGVSIGTVIGHVNSYLGEYGDWGGRTMSEWRTEALVDIEDRLMELNDDMNIQPIPRLGGEEPGWDLSPLGAAQTRLKARKLYSELQQQKQKLLGLLVNRTEVDVESKVMVVKIKGVDLSMLQG